MAAEEDDDDGEPSSSLAVLNASLSDLEVDVGEIKAALRDRYLKRLEFDPVRSLVYSLVGGVLMAAIAALLALVIRR